MRLVAAALGACFAFASLAGAGAASAGTYIDVRYDGVATGWDGGGLFGPAGAHYVDAPFAETWSFYGDGIGPLYSVGLQFTIDGSTLTLPGSALAGDYVRPGYGRIDAYVLRRVAGVGYQYVETEISTVSGNTPSDEFQSYSTAVSATSWGNKFYIEGRNESGGYASGFGLTPLSLTVSSWDGEAPGCCQTTGGALAFVPEPGVWALLLIGFFGLGGALRAQRRQAEIASSPLPPAAAWH